MNIAPTLILPSISATPYSISKPENKENFLDLLREKISSIRKKTSHIAYHCLKSLSWIAIDANTIAGIGRKLDKQVFRSMEYLVKLPGLVRLHSGVANAVGLIDTIQVLPDLEYFYEKKYKTSRIYEIFAKIFFTISDITGALIWFEEMHFFSLSKMAASVAEVRVFSFVPTVLNATIPSCMISPSLIKISTQIGKVQVFGFMNSLSIQFISFRALTLAYVFCATDAIYRLLIAQNSTERTQAVLDIAAYLSELVLDALYTVGVINPYLVGGAGVVAISLLVTSFLYKMYNPSNIEIIEENKNTTNNIKVN